MVLIKFRAASMFQYLVIEWLTHIRDIAKKIYHYIEGLCRMVLLLNHYVEHNMAYHFIFI